MIWTIWRAKAHCFRGWFLHISSFSWPILDFSDFWDFRKPFNLKSSFYMPWISQTCLEMILEKFWKYHFFIIFGQNFRSMMSNCIVMRLLHSSGRSGWYFACAFLFKVYTLPKIWKNWNYWFTLPKTWFSMHFSMHFKKSDTFFIGALYL